MEINLLHKGHENLYEYIHFIIKAVHFGSNKNVLYFLVCTELGRGARWGILGGHGGMTVLSQYYPLKMHLSCFMMRMDKMNIFLYSFHLQTLYEDSK